MIATIPPRPCIFCYEENTHARAYPVPGDDKLLYCPTCKMFFDVSEYDDTPQGALF